LAETLSFGLPFDCPECGIALRIKRSYEVTLRVFAFAAGIALAYGAGFRSVLLVLGFMPAAFLIKLIWKVARTALPPGLDLFQSSFTTLDLRP
jgi:hypothetical protein